MTLEQYLLKAGRALASARLLLENGDIEGSCNRAYYAMFDAAHAALLRHQPGINPAETRTHNGLITAFGKHLIKTGLMTPELGRVLNQVEHPPENAIRLNGLIKPDTAIVHTLCAELELITSEQARQCVQNLKDDT